MNKGNATNWSITRYVEQKLLTSTNARWDFYLALPRKIYSVNPESSWYLICFHFHVTS